MMTLEDSHSILQNALQDANRYQWLKQRMECRVVELQTDGTQLVLFSTALRMPVHCMAFDLDTAIDAHLEQETPAQREP